VTGRVELEWFAEYYVAGGQCQSLGNFSDIEKAKARCTKHAANLKEGGSVSGPGLEWRKVEPGKWTADFGEDLYAVIRTRMKSNVAYERAKDVAIRQQKIAQDYLRTSRMLEDAKRRQRLAEDASRQYRLADPHRKLREDLAARLAHQQKIDAKRWSGFIDSYDIVGSIERRFRESAALERIIGQSHRDLADSAFSSLAKQAAESALSYQELLSGSFAADRARRLSQQMQAMNQLTEQSFYKLAVSTFSTIRETWPHDFFAEVSKTGLQVGLDNFGLRDAEIEEVASTALVESVEYSQQDASISDEDAFSALLARVWRSIDSGFSNLSQESKVTIFCTVVSVLVAIILFTSQAARDDRAQGNLLTATESVTDEIRTATQAVIAGSERHLHQTRKMLTRRPIPLREEHEAAAKRICTVPQGQELYVVDQFDHWLYVEYVEAGVSRGGWVYYRNLIPVTVDSPVHKTASSEAASDRD